MKAVEEKEKEVAHAEENVDKAEEAEYKENT